MFSIEGRHKVVLVVVGRPTPSPRPRARAMPCKGGRVVAQVYQQEPKFKWKGRVRAAAARLRVAKGDMPWEERVRVKVEFVLAIPGGAKWKRAAWAGQYLQGQPGDVDNMLKPVLDALVQAKVLVSDRRVPVADVEMRYGHLDEEGCAGQWQGVKVTIWRLDALPRTKAEAVERGFPVE